MHRHGSWMAHLLFSLIVFFTAVSFPSAAPSPELKFDHNHTYGEVAAYLQDLTRRYPNITKLLTIGKSFQGKDLLVLEITNHSTGQALEKPGYWIDGNLHASEVFGAEICLKNIDTLVTQYGKDPFVTNLVDTRTIYIMPKLNPDGSDYYLTNPDSLRSVVRPHDDDGDGLLDEDPSEDLDGNIHITQIRIRDPLGPMKTSPEDPRLLVPRKEDEKGEWRVYSEGIDNDKDGLFNEDGVGGLDINRNWPAQWQQDWKVRGSGAFPLSEPETRAVAEFILSHRNITGTINHHMAGNFVYRPPNGRNPDPSTGEESQFPREDEEIYELFGKKYTEIVNNQKVVVVYGRPGSPGETLGMFMDWAYLHAGVVSWLPEVGQNPCDYNKDGRVTDLEGLRWNDTEMGKKIFVDWKPYNHPQLGQVEIGGFVSKLYNPASKTYVHLMCSPGPIYEDYLVKHTKWNLYLISMSPLVRITNVDVTPGDAGYFKIVASIQNQGFLPTHITQQAIRNKTARIVKAAISLEGAVLVSGGDQVDIGHLPGNTPRSTSPIKKVEWVVKASGKGAPVATIKAISDRGGTDTKKMPLALKQQP